MELTYNHYWRGLDYHASTDQLVIHAENPTSNYQEDAHVIFSYPKFICCASLLEVVQFNLDNDPNQLAYSSTAADPFISVCLHSKFDSKFYDFYVVCKDLKYVFQPDSGDLGEYHTPEIFLKFKRFGRGKVIERRAMLEKFDGCTLKLKSMSSSLSCEMKLSVTGNVEAQSIIFRMPYFISIPREMSSVRIRPASMNDVDRIRQQLGERFDRILAYQPRQGGKLIEDKLVNIVTFECDEGFYFLCTEGVDFDLGPMQIN